MGFGSQFLALEADFGLWQPILGFGSQFGHWELEPIFGFGKPIFGLWEVIGSGSQFLALGGDLGFGLPGPGKAPEV